MKICFASHNRNKVKEIAALAPPHLEVMGLDELGITEEIPEPGATLEENSAIKARYVYDKLAVPAFADDSGLEVDALEGAPGVHSARFAGEEKDDEKNIDLLLSKLANSHDRNAQFKTVITFINRDGEDFQFAGTVSGVIGKERRGSNGFGYDPVFTPEGYDQTFAELTDSEKNAISHRARAFKQFLDYLQTIDE